jgi:hypothetical protein
LFNNHGTLVSAVGPVVDVLVASDAFLVNNQVISSLSRLSVPGVSSHFAGLTQLYFPSIYDSVFLVNRVVYFRDGISLVQNSSSLMQYMTALPFNSSFLQSISHVSPLSYALDFDSDIFADMVSESIYLNYSCVVIGFASILTLVKGYSNFLGAEISQL